MEIQTYIITSGLRNASLNKLQDGADLGHTGLLGMFTAMLSPSGNLPATHYVSTGILSPEEIAYLDNNLPPAFTKDVGRNPFDVFVDNGLNLISGE